MAATYRVLIVEDDVSVRVALEMAYQETPHEAVLVPDAEAGMAALVRGRFDAIIADKNLPGRSGTDLLREVRERDRSVVFAVITAHASTENAVESLGLGVDAYIHKPFDVFDLIDQVTSLIERRGRRPKSGELVGANQHFQKATMALQALTPQNGTTALVVSPDDNEREWLSVQVTRLGLAVDQASGVDEAQSAIRGRHLKVVVIDGRLGWDTTRILVTEIRTRDPNTGMVVVSDERPPLNVVTDLINLGVGSLLTRPVDAARFRLGLERVAGAIEAEIQTGRGAVPG